MVCKECEVGVKRSNVLLLRDTSSKHVEIVCDVAELCARFEWCLVMSEPIPGGQNCGHTGCESYACVRY